MNVNVLNKMGNKKLNYRALMGISQEQLLDKSLLNPGLALARVLWQVRLCLSSSVNVININTLQLFTQLT